MKLTEKNIQARLYELKRSSHEICMPNYTPHGWWECDLWAVTSAGYWVEYEIKLTASDYQNDFKKAMEPKWDPVLKQNREVSGKHEQLASGGPKCPKSFWYVMPTDLAIDTVVPSYAGKIGVSLRGGRWIQPVVLKEAPTLNRQAKAPAKEIERARRACYYRMWAMKIRQP